MRAAGATCATSGPRLLSGGSGKITSLVLQEGASNLPAELVVRQDWAGGGVPGKTVVSEYALIKSVFAAGLKVSEPLLIEASSVLGASFLVMTRMAGRQYGSYFDPPRSLRLALGLAEQLAKLHRLPTAPFVEVGVHPGARTAAKMATALDGFRAVQSRCGWPHAVLISHWTGWNANARVLTPNFGR